MEAAIIAGLLGVIGVLIGLFYRDGFKRITKLEKKTSALLVAMFFFVSNQNPVPKEVLASLKEAMEDS